MNYKVSTKLEINKDFPGIAEVVGLYPSGQSGYKEPHWQIMINGHRLMLPESVISTMFKEIPDELVREEITTVMSVPVIPETITIKKLVRKEF